MSARLRLVRHGRAAAGWDNHRDPGLDDVGQAQAEAVTLELAPLGPLPIVCSPMRRTRETAEPLATAWRVEPVVDAAVGEIPAPAGVEMGERVVWLRRAVEGSWSDLGQRHESWRSNVVDRLLALTADTVIVSHFVAINAAIGAAVDDDRVVVARLDNCSVTVIDIVDGALRLVEIGREADTLIR
ncbi:MAG: histidine phosphatase family protein [Acidimicrobiales bacterium]